MTVIGRYDLNLGTQRWMWKQRMSTSAPVLSEIGLPEHDDFKVGWKESQVFPSEIHVELLKSKAIPDPYIGFNEHQVQWIGDVEWLYKCTFPCETASIHKHAMLTFQGLDTICDVYLNNTRILATDNMFRTYVYPISLVNSESNGNILKEENTLLLHFKSAKALAKAEEEKYGKVRAGSTNLGDPSRVYVRKAQYDWRWDWGPELLTCGPYRPITFTTYNVLIKEVHTRATAEIKSDGSYTASLKIDIIPSGYNEEASIGAFLVTLRDDQQVLLKSQRIENPQSEGLPGIHEKVVAWERLEDDGIQLWWPVGYGKPTMYTVQVQLLSVNDDILDSISKRVGFRSAQIIQEPITEPDQYGTGSTFLFEINGVRMFMGGSNWIPADNFVTTISEERYRAWLTLLRDGNQNMVRLWGGGMYEPDVFYDTCDELGILVWQDFQFACGVYPAHDDFVASVRQEAEDNVKRLRHHPSIVCFCGNNEDYQLVLQWGGIGELPARLLYEHVLPDVVSRLTDPPIPYHRGSPYGGKGWDTSDPTIGDVHQWNIWGGKEFPYQEYDKMGGRFISEFGIPSMPSMETIKYWMQGADNSQWYPQSQLMAQHTKAGSFERRFAIVMNENFKLTTDFETHVFNTQLMQSEAVGFAYRMWRREWRGRGREYAAGVLVWQMNDCWPGVSWAIADYFLRPKAVYYTIARQLAPITVGLFRTVIKNRDNDRPRQFYEFGAIQSLYATLDIWAANSTLQPRTAILELRFFDLLLSEWSHCETKEVVLSPNQTTELHSLRCPGPQYDGVSVGEPLSVNSATVVVSVRLLDVNTGMVLARHSDWPEPYRFLRAPDPDLTVKAEVVRGGDGVEETELTLSVNRPAKCVVLSVEDPCTEIKWSDNALDLVPGDSQIVVVKNLKEKQKIKVARFGQEKARFI